MTLCMLLDVCRLQRNARLVVRVCAFFYCCCCCSFTPFNRIFIAMNQSSMADLTTSCSLITFDGKVTNQPNQRRASVPLCKIWPQRNAQTKIFNSVCHSDWFLDAVICCCCCSILLLFVVEHITWTKIVTRTCFECERDRMQTIHKFDFYFFWMRYLVCMVRCRLCHCFLFTLSLGFFLSFNLSFFGCLCCCSSGCLSLFIVCNLV